MEDSQKRRSIEDRSAAVNDNIEIGHWERDMVEGKAHKDGLGTFVDRKKHVSDHKQGCEQELWGNEGDNC